MDGSSDTQIVERQGDGWTYRIDATTAPDYVLVTQTGEATHEADDTNDYGFTTMTLDRIR